MYENIFSTRKKKGITVVILEPYASAEKWAHLIDARRKEKVADVENHLLELTTGHDHQFNARQQ